MKTLIVRQNSSIMTISLNRPAVRNAIDENTILELTQILKKINTDKNIRVVCLEGTGDTFCAGADLNWMKRAAKYSRKENLEDAKHFSDLLETLYHLKKPTLAIVKGGAYGGALGLIASCDIVIAEKSAQFAFSETKIGLIPAIISPYIIKAIGERNAKRYFLTAETFTTLEAKNIGLIHEVVDKKSLDKTSKLITEHLLENSPQALSMTKQLFEPIDKKAINQSLQLLVKSRSSKEAIQGIQAFLEKR